MTDTIFYKTQGLGKVAVVNDSDVEYLEIDNKIIAINIDGPVQNIYNKYFIKGDFCSDYLNTYLKEIDFDFYTQKDLFRQHSIHIDDLLKVFESGIFYLNEVVNFYVTEFNNENKLVVGGWLDPSQILLFTREKANLSREIIDSYKEEINQGNKPIVLAYRKDYGLGSDDGESYIIDGHHKLVAYKELDQAPLIYEIVNVGHDDYDEIDKPRVEQILQHKVEVLLRKHVR